MIDYLLRLVLVGWLVLGTMLSLPQKVAWAMAGLEEQPPDARRDFLLAKKADEWQILRDLGQLTQAPGDRFIPTYPDLPFVMQRDGTVLLADQRYHRYIQVSSADELVAALAKAEAGDFIHLLDGLYAGNFVIDRSGLADQPIALYGSRQAILDGQNIKQGYGLHLQADHWQLLGFTIRNAAKGLMADSANHILISGLELYQIGDEGLHLRRASSHNRIEKVWIHDVGLVRPEFGEGIYIGSALSNWATYSGGEPDRSDHNVVIGNVLGPALTAEGIDIKEGTTGGLIQNNTFLTDKTLVADSWIDLKGNAYVVTDNLGSYQADSLWRMAVDVLHLAAGWGEENTIAGNQDFKHKALPAMPFFVPPPTVPNHGRDSFTRSAYLILPARLLPYTLSELTAYFPASLSAFGAETTLLRENLLVGRNATLWITTNDTHRVRLLSTPERFVTINGFLAQLKLQGSLAQRLDFEAWDVTQAKADTERQDGRAYILAAAGRMDITYAGFFDLGYEEGTVSGASWKSVGIDGGMVLSYGNVSHSHFVRNYFGAYTYEAIEMRWIGNTFADNIEYGFDPHDFSDYFLFEDNIAYGNGSHGIIFSRGCNHNIIRNNKSYDNGGHGIMIDDGKVAPDSDNVRHLAAVPSNHNLIENNIVTNNEDGIVLEGGAHNIVRNNTIIGPHRYGIRLKDDVTHTLVVSNTIEQSERFAIFVYNNSANNRFEHNVITGAPGGLFLQDAPATTFTANAVKNIAGTAIALQGNVASSLISGNRFSGSGRQPLDIAASGLRAKQIWDANDFSQWRHPTPFLIQTLVIGVWALILFVPIVMWIRRNLRNRRMQVYQIT